MIDPSLLKNAQHVNELKSDVSEYDTHPLDRERIAGLGRRLVNSLDHEGTYHDDDSFLQAQASAVISYAPALILRKRSKRGLVEIFETIIDQLGSADEVPSGILPLVDPNHQVGHDADTTPGGLVHVDDDRFLPLPVNEQQLRILQSVDTRAQTVVQGPPGTGKTHTAAVLISHLLAQGKRVLVTAHTDRALDEVRGKLPEEVRALSVAVVGSSRDDMAQLKSAVDTIAERTATHDPADDEHAIEQQLAAIDQLRRDRAETFAKLLAARRQEVDTHDRGELSGTLAALALQYQADAGKYEWIVDYADVPADAAPPFTDGGTGQWLSYLRDRDLANDEAAASGRLLDLDRIPEPEQFAQGCVAEADAAKPARAHDQLINHEAFKQIRQVPSVQRAELQRMMRTLADEARTLEARHEPWIDEALLDVRAGRGAPWQARATEVRDLIQHVHPIVETLGPLTVVEVLGGDVASLRRLAERLREHLAAGNTLKLMADGRPKVSFLSAKVVKDAGLLFEHVRVNGLRPTTSEAVDAFLQYVAAETSLAALDRAWPTNVVIPDDDTHSERLQWHMTELAQLDRVIEFQRKLEQADQQLNALGVRPPQWLDSANVRQYAELVDAATALDERDRAAAPLEALIDVLTAETRWLEAGHCVQGLLDAVTSRNPATYTVAHSRLKRLHEVRVLATERDEFERRVATAAPDLAQAVTTSYDDPAWDRRLTEFEAAWRWSALGSWIRGQQTTDVNALQAQVTEIENRIRRHVTKLAALRAWKHALAPDRMTGQAVADLTLYAQLVKRLGRGTGRYADGRRVEIRKAMEACRGSVPVWIMPIYRIAEQFKVKENMFDVVVVDEASQAGVDASFLQYLAPRIVVVGDDKQVSPAAVGVYEQNYIDLANQYLAHDRYKASWQDPKRSLFDEALMRFGGDRITLVEHRRCVHEIIGFSNQIAYEPDGVRLVPVRQYGADRLEPIKPVLVPTGYTKGSASKINPPEAEALVDQIEKCLADYRYDGLSIGVISLQGKAQAEHIEKLLFERLPPDEWKARDLRCGDATDFQGSERDVIFLSMVAALDGPKRLRALTDYPSVQRFNVAASRAKDQMWLFHSVPLSELGHPDDMRFRLLDYCYGVAERRQTDVDGVLLEAIPEDRKVEPFDSLFEQRVFNRIYDRGYSVIPQYSVEGYRIDLVVVGAQGRLAVECDGDHWHGPDAYERDSARQRDLERCGWRFFRVRESAFYTDRAGELAKLWEKLDELEIRPRGPARETQMWAPPQGLSDEPRHEMESTSLSESPGPPPPPPLAIVPGIDVELPTLPLPHANAAVVESVANSAIDDAPVADGAAADLRHYSEFLGQLEHPSGATLQELIAGIIEVVSAEGPMTGTRLHTAYVKASGRQRVGKSVRRSLNSAITAAVRQGALVEDNPTDESGIKHRTYRVPQQPVVLPRVLGPRELDEVPPSELAALLEDAASSQGWDDQEALFRSVLRRLELVRLTPNVRETLQTAFEVARPMKNDSTDR